MSMSVSVFGLGYVGCVSAACLAKEGHDVIGVDVSETKVDMINAGRATIVENGIAELVREMVDEGRLRATTDAREALANSSISLVCVGTPSRANGSIDLRYLERACVEIGEGLRAKSEHHTVVIRSTVVPGTLEQLVIPALERASGRQAGVNLGVCLNPEFLREGTSIADFYNPPFTLIGSSDPCAAEALGALYAGVAAPVHVTEPGVAEMMKYTCNSFHGVKVAFANEIGNVCKALGVDSHEVMRLFCLDTKLNISSAYLRPGFAFGGSCLPKDLRAITHRARQLDVETPLLAATYESNRKHIERAFDMVLATGSRRVGVLGLAFKSGTDDLRESPVVTLVEKLIGKGLQLSVYDREVASARLIGSNKEYIEREIPHIWSLMRGSVAEVLDTSDVVVIGNGSAEFRAIESKLDGRHVVVDLVRAYRPQLSTGERYQGICW
jgi:GDP-mannose 6-dehydrogenase